MKKILLLTAVLTSAFSCLSAQTHTHQDFVDYMNAYNKTQFSSHKKLTLMHKKRNLEKLGKESVNGDVSGTLSYKTKLSGFSGVVIMEFKDYCDDGEWIIDGFTNTKANIWSNGKMFGTVTVSGMHAGKVIYDDLLIRKGNAGGGWYTVELSDGESDKVMWDEIINEKIANEADDVE